MSTFDYSRPLATANRLIAKFGQDGALRREGPATGNPWDPTAGAPTDHPVRFVIVAFDNRDIDGTRILTTDKKALLAPGSLTIVPTNSDTLVDADGAAWKIVDVDPLRPAETTLLYTLQVRK